MLAAYVALVFKGKELRTTNLDCEEKASNPRVEYLIELSFASFVRRLAT